MFTKKLSVPLLMVALVATACGSQTANGRPAAVHQAPSEATTLRVDLEHLLAELTPAATAVEPACDLSLFSERAPARLVVVADDSVSARALDPRTRGMMRILTDILSFGDTFVAFWPNENQPWLNETVPARDIVARWPGTPPAVPAEVSVSGGSASLEELRRLTQKTIDEFGVVFPGGGAEETGQGKGLDSTAQIRWKNSARRLLQGEDVARARAVLKEWRLSDQGWAAAATRYNQECALVPGLHEQTAQQKHLIDGASPAMATCSPVRQAITRAAATARRGQAGVRLIVVSGDLEPSPCPGIADLASLPPGLLEGIHVLVAPFRPDDGRSNYISAERDARALLAEGSPKSVTVIFDDEPTAAIGAAALEIVRSESGQTLRKGVVSR
ncbi:MAG: hypothetical protein EPO16_11490 [Dehalococcoidia bacterium]|nr:MAG: hypothetical protein EPO16_11490 [Dehalococcoidia bacterium]